MAYVLSVFALGLACAAWKSETRGMRTVLALLCLLNFGCAAKMIHDGYPYAFRLEPRSTAPGINDEPKPWLPAR